MLTIAISVASGADAVFSLLPGRAEFEAVDRVGIGPRESIKVLLPIFLGFFVTPRAAYPLRYPLLVAFLGLGMLAGEGPGRHPLLRLSRRLSDRQHRPRHYSVRESVRRRAPDRSG
jgi:hypothetical protein